MAGTPRSMWKGAVAFGLVTVPVKLFNATESDYGLKFNMLHRADGSRIQMRVWCPVEEQIIERTDTVKGFEYAPDQYVIVTDEDLEKLPLRTVKTVTVEQFVPRDDANLAGQLRFAKGTYYMEPDKIGRKAYYLLRDTLIAKSVIAICKVVLRERETMAALEPFGNTMLLTTLRWPDEIRVPDWVEITPKDTEFSPAETAMAGQLVDALAGSFDPANFHDSYRDALLALVQAKIDGTVPETAPDTPSSALPDLVEMLKASIEATEVK